MLNRRGRWHEHAPVRQEFFPLGGGLDLLTPAIAIKPGMCIGAQNFEPEISGGYKRYAGHERYDGRTSPSSANTRDEGHHHRNDCRWQYDHGRHIGGHWKSPLPQWPTIIFGRLTGTWLTNETILVSAVSQGTTTSTANINGASMPSDDADYTFLQPMTCATILQWFLGLVRSVACGSITIQFMRSETT